MELHELIKKENIQIFEEPPPDKIRLLKDLLECCVANSELRKLKDTIWETLLEREKSMSTGIGLGVAIPHCSTKHVSEVHGILALLKHGIDFQAVDEQPVRIIVLLLMPKDKFDKHIKTLASIARLFNNEDFRQRILSAASAGEAHEILINESEKSE